MKKALLGGMVGAGLATVFLGRRLAANRGEFSVEKMLERMPDTAPPKWMYLNITAIRENTDRILERLEEHEKAPAPDDREEVVA